MQSSESSKFIQIAIKECNQAYLDMKYNKTKKCKPQSESDRVAAFVKLQLVM